MKIERGNPNYLGNPNYRGNENSEEMKMSRK